MTGAEWGWRTNEDGANRHQKYWVNHPRMHLAIGITVKNCLRKLQPKWQTVYTLISLLQCLHIVIRNWSTTFEAISTNWAILSFTQFFKSNRKNSLIQTWFHHASYFNKSHTQTLCHLHLAKSKILSSLIKHIYNVTKHTYNVYMQ